MALLKSSVINQPSDNDNYLQINDNQRTGANKPSSTTNKLYANTTGLFWEELQLDRTDYATVDEATALAIALG